MQNITLKTLDSHLTFSQVGLTDSYIREEILLGNIPCPCNVIFRKFPNKEYEITKLWYKLVDKFMQSEITSSLIAYDQLDYACFNYFVISLTKQGWVNCESSSKKKWSQLSINKSKVLEYVSEDELTQVIQKYLSNKYSLSSVEPSNPSDNQTVKTYGKYNKNTNLTRTGFAKAGSRTFQLDTDAMVKHQSTVKAAVTKSMRKLREQLPELPKTPISYDSVCEHLIDEYISNPSYEYTIGKTIIDSRGRGNPYCMTKAGNPISTKDIRAMLVIPPNQRVKGCSKQDIEHVYAFISELTDSSKEAKSFEDKVKQGSIDYVENELPEEGEKTMYKRIWLERLYKELDRFFNLHCKDVSNLDRLLATVTIQSRPAFKWKVPIELDASASMLQLLGCLLNDEKLLKMSNVITNKINDPWYSEVVPRKVVKKIFQPLLYGSSKSIKQALNALEYDYSQQEYDELIKLLMNDGFNLFNMFKEFIIRNVQPKAKMRISIKTEIFNIFCNRFTRVGEKHIARRLFDSESNSFQTLINTETKEIPNLKRFKRYFVTLLIHNLDSQIADYISDIVGDIGFIIPIHDAFIVSPSHARLVKDLYARKLKEINYGRSQILTNYFNCCGIKSKKAMLQWQKLIKHITPVSDFQVSDLALK